MDTLLHSSSPVLLSRPICQDCQELLYAAVNLGCRVLRHRGLLASPGSAEHQCHMCDFLFGCVQEKDRDALRNLFAAKFQSGKLVETDRGLEAVHEIHGELKVDNTAGFESGYFWIRSPLYGYEHLAIYGERSGDASIKAVDNDTGSDTSLHLAQHWFEDCLASHEKCTIANNVERLPTRLIEVGSNDFDVRLCGSQHLSKHIRYATLSHCWGNIPMFKLLNNNLDSLQDRIPYEELCKTFQDAIRTTRRFGLLYLWIDSLCIIQDNNTDWASESVSMSHIYGSSALNLAASGAADGNAGLFFHRAPLSVKKFRLPVPPVASDTSGVKMMDMWELDPFKRWVVRGPLGARAWAFQERFLSPRTLYFGATQLMWECNQHCTNETHSEGSLNVYADSSIRIKHLAANPSTYRKQLWRKVVEEFSYGLLTNANDKLVAISGVAKWVQNKYDGTYICGLWKEDLASGLLWTISNGRKPNIYRAPSWSWASLDGSVEFYRSGMNPPLAIKVIDADATPLGHDIFGQVTAGYVRLRCGILVSAVCPHFLKFYTVTDSTCLSFNLDDDLASKCLDSTCYYLCVEVGSFYGHLKGLLLQSTQDRGKFRRIGNFGFIRMPSKECFGVFSSLQRIPDYCAKAEMYEEHDGLETDDYPHIITLI